MVKRNPAAELVIGFLIPLLIFPLVGKNSLIILAAYLAVTFVVMYYFTRDTLGAIVIAASELVLFLIALPIINALELYFVMAIEKAKLISFWSSIYYTLLSAIAAGIFGVLLAIPFGYAYTRNMIPYREVIRSIVELPMMVPHTIAGILLLGIYSRTGLLGISLVDTVLGIVIAMFFVSMPIAMNYMIDAFEHVSRRYEYVSRSLGASPIKTFLYVLLPMVKNDIVSAFVTSCTRAISEFGAIVVITTYPPVISQYTFGILTSKGLKEALAVSVLTFLVILPIIVLLKVLSRGKEYGKH